MLHGALKNYLDAVDLNSLKLITRAEMFTRLANHYAENIHQPFDFVMVDEA